MKKRTMIAVVSVVLVGVVVVGVPLGLAKAYSEGVKRGTTDQEEAVRVARADAESAQKEARDARRELQASLDDIDSKMSFSYYRGFYDLCNAVLLSEVSEAERTAEFISATIDKCIGYTKQVIEKDPYSIDSVGYEFVYASEE